MAGDPNFNDVVLLMHADVSDGGLVDYSQSAHAITAHGNAQINGDSPVFGDGSAYFDGIKATGAGTGDGGGHFLVEKDLDFDFGTGDFTIELLLNPNELKYAIFFSTGQLNSPYYGIRFQMGLDGSVGCSFNTDGLVTFNTLIDSNGPVLSIGTATHIALSCESQVVRLFIDGVLKSSDTLTGPLPNYNAPVQIGVDYSSGGLSSARPYLNAYIDELRVTEGVARYTANFTPPIGPHPNSLFVPDVSGNIVESTGIVDWRVTLIDSFGSIQGSAIFSGSTYLINAAADKYFFATLIPEIDRVWLASKSITLNDYLATTDALGDWYIWQCTTAGTTGASKPTFNLSGTTVDNTCTWTFVAPLPKPTIEGPLLAS